MYVCIGVDFGGQPGHAPPIIEKIIGRGGGLHCIHELTHTYVLGVDGCIIFIIFNTHELLRVLENVRDADKIQISSEDFSGQLLCRRGTQFVGFD